MSLQLSIKYGRGKAKMTELCCPICSEKYDDLYNSLMIRDEQEKYYEPGAIERIAFVMHVYESHPINDLVLMILKRITFGK